MRKHTARNLAWKASNRDKYLAHKAVENAVKAGRLVPQPCQRCGATHIVHAHHDDYGAQLDVTWLCPLHHRERRGPPPRISDDEALRLVAERRSGTAIARELGISEITVQRALSRARCILELRGDRREEEAA